MLPLLGLLAVFARERRDRLEQLLELNDAYRGTALVLGDVVEADDGYTGEHSRGVVRALPRRRRAARTHRRAPRNLEFGALLHDVGKIAIPKEIINKPGKLDDDEWTIIKTHTIEGQKLLDTVGGFMREVGLIVRSHHERWDGGGYPTGSPAKRSRSSRGSSPAATPGTRCAPTAPTARRCRSSRPPPRCGRSPAASWTRESSRRCW